MKNSKLFYIAWVFFALILTSTTVFSQGWGNRNRMNYNQNRNCLNNISGITEKQQTQIEKMEDEHHKGMDELRDKRRSTTNAIEKSELRTEMLKNVEAHQNSVKKVLTADQQKQYEQLHVYGNNGRNQQFTNNGGNRNFARGGNGNGNYARGNKGGACYLNTNFSRRSGNFQNGNGNRTYCQNTRNNFRRQNANYGRGGRNGNYHQGNGHFHQQDSCTGHGSRSIDEEGFKVIEESKF